MTTTATQTDAAAIHARVDHPIIDGDSHIVEFTPVFNDYLKEVGGSEMVDRLAGRGRNGGSKGWHSIDWDERRHRQVVRPPWWALPTKNTLDRATSMLPKLYHERLPDFGMDFVVLYPSVGLGFPHIADDELRQAACRAFNEFTAASYGEYGDRMTVAAVIPLHTPEEGLAELEHAHDLGLKVAQIPAFVRRPVPAIAEKYPELANTVTWYDSFGIDSPHDYDPFWARCVELGFAVASHSAGMGLPDRASVSNYMHNHMGHFAATGEMLCKALLMGGVTRRFPDLRVGLLEGGVANGCRLYADIIARWEKRNLDAQENLDPANLDLELAQSLFQEYGDAATLAKLDELDKALVFGPREIDASLRDDFAAMEIERPEDFRDLFIPSFYFGCEADDPLNAWAFDRNVNPFDSEIRAIMSTDLGHWDVPDMTKAVAEAYEPIENGLFSADDFRTFAFTNQVRLYAHTNHDFFNGTAVEAAAADLLADEPLP